jgi:ADP-ribose pyrophosphatase
VSAHDDLSLRETRLDSELVYQGHFLTVYRDTVRLPSSSTATREYIRHPGAVVVIALTDDGQVVMERQFRYPMDRVMLELPAGKLDAGEDPLECARRELLEETGYVARHWARAGEMHNAIAYSTEVIHIYFAKGLTQQQAHLDEEEFLEVYTESCDALFRGVAAGEITDAKTITALFWLQSLLQGRWNPQWHEILSGR